MAAKLSIFSLGFAIVLVVACSTEGTNTPLSRTTSTPAGIPSVQSTVTPTLDPAVELGYDRDLLESEIDGFVN